MRHFLRFPGFETYQPPTKDEEHIEDILTEKEIEKMEKKEIRFQANQKKRKAKEKENKKRKRAKSRMKKLNS